MTEGITLRDYFIAHAPTEPWDWFEPVMPPAPKPTPQKNFYGDCRHLPEYLQYQQDIANARDEIGKWDKEKERQRMIQWPIFWADTMLEAREK